MVDRETGPGAPSLGDWPMDTVDTLARNGIGTFDWDLDSGRMYMDSTALSVFDLRSGEYNGDPSRLRTRMPADEITRLFDVVARALEERVATYGTYFRRHDRHGTVHWTHTQGNVQRDASGHPYRIVGILRDAALELGQVAERLKLEEDRRHRTSIVEETTSALADALTVQDVIEVLGDSHGMGRLGTVSLLMGLVENGRIHVVAEGQAGSYVPELEYTRMDDQFPMSEAVRTMAPVLIRSREDFARRYPGLWPHIEPLNVSAAVYLPLIAQARPIGALGLLYPDAPAFGPEERNLLTALSSSIAQSLQRAMLYDQEHDIAQSLQRAMLPRSIPAVPAARVAVRYRSARFGRDIGGDWYDVIPLPGGRVGAVIGDVEGHDTHAAAVMGQLRIALRAYAAEGHAPATVMARASDFLHELDTDRFATCTYAEADPAAGVLRMVRAGHIDPLLRRADGSCHSLPLVGGLPLGLSARSDYPVTPVVLDPGATLLMYTDGLIEQPGADLDQGLRLLMAAVDGGPGDPEALADHLFEVMGERAGEDDMALLLLNRETATVTEPARRLRLRIAAADPAALAEARRAIGQAVRAWEAGDRADEVQLVADELITNALLHTDGGATVTLTVLPGPERRLRAEVEDRSSSRPRRREPGEAGVSGRGLLLVDRLADVWGVEPRGAGKAVWCEFICAVPKDR